MLIELTALISMIWMTGLAFALPKVSRCALASRGTAYDASLR